MKNIEKMKLKYEYEGLNYIIFFIKFFIVVVGTYCIFGTILARVIMKDFLLGEVIKKCIINIMPFGIITILLCLISIVGCKLQKVENNKIIKNGKKYSGYIINCDKTKLHLAKYTRWPMCFLEVELSSNNIITINSIANNIAFKYLQQSYKEKLQLRIPIDIYIDDTDCKEKIYADLENLQIEVL